MTGLSFQVSCMGMADDLAASLAPLAEAAGKALDLVRDFSGIRICGDDLPGQDSAWYRLQPGPGPDDLPVLVLFCQGACFGRGEWATESVKPPPAVWELSRVPAGESREAGMEFSAERSSIFLHHHLLTAHDLVCGDVVGRDLPVGVTEAFPRPGPFTWTDAWPGGACQGIPWRKGGAGLPGYSLPRVSFCRTIGRFSSPSGMEPLRTRRTSWTW
jgi:hypothetical protein